MSVGRPTKYTEVYCKKLIEHMAKGLSYETFGAVVGVSKQTVYDWEKVHPEFLDAKKVGWQQCQLFWERMGVSGAAGKIKNFNSTAYIYNMKNRFRKSETWAPVKEETQSNVEFKLSYDPARLGEENDAD